MVILDKWYFLDSFHSAYQSYFKKAIASVKSWLWIISSKPQISTTKNLLPLINVVEYK
jgi:hypothetical protein